jgi:uncharacterized protein (TIGR02646 family)
MKRIIKGDEPERLKAYREARPDNSWEQFNQKDARKREVQERLIEDQGGLCAYCEVDLKPGVDEQLADLRVEHFHPKSDRTTGKNWHLEWSNLLACCHAGSQKGVVDADERYTSPDHHSCDVPKGQHNWDEDIINPLHLPAFPPIFKYQRSNGSIQVDPPNCQQAGLDPTKAQATIDKLRLDAERLRNLRQGELNRINELMISEVAKGLSVAEARQRLAKALLRKDGNNRWPKFFSAIRSYLGSAAEEQLGATKYDG